MKGMFCSPRKIGVPTLALALAIWISAAPGFAESWKFGIMSDTQWSSSPDGKNPNTVAVNVINHVNQEFINHGVKFVIQVGDVVDSQSTTSLDTTATFRQALYNAGIGFYPLRGNHENNQASAREFQRIFPQTQTGVNNQTPLDALMTTPLYGPPPANTHMAFPVGANFNSLTNWEGLTYSFDYANARFVLIDQFTSPVAGVSSHSTLNTNDVTWVGNRLSSKPADSHAFVFSHKGIITENHADNLFGSSPTAEPGLTNTFMANLAGNGVRYFIGGHDHMHNRAIVTSPDGSSKVQNVITASDSFKFYIPSALPAWSSRETPIAQELFAIGYYIVTVDGPNVTVDYYASPNGCNGDCDLSNDVIPYTFTRRESFGYSLNGKEVLVFQGGSYQFSDDTTKAIAGGETGYIGTAAAILSGTNGSTGKDYRGRALSKSVNTGWAPASVGIASDVLTLWGMEDSLATDFTDLGNPNLNYRYVSRTNRTDKYVLSLSYNPTHVVGDPLSGAFGLTVKDKYRGWVNAVSKNFGGVTSFVSGPWNEGYGLGTYGVDTANHTAWAVVNHNSDFAVAPMNAANVPPSVTIIVPAHNDFFDSPADITISANAVDSDGTVVKVEFYNGAQKIGEATAAPFTITWNGILSGSYSLSAVATDIEGLSAPSASINITVNNLDNVLPSVALTAPLDGAGFLAGDTIALTATATDTDGLIGKVEFYSGATKLGEHATAPYAYSWPSVAIGNYKLTAVAIDNDGGSEISQAVNVSVIPIPPGGISNFSADFNSMGSTGTAPPVGWSIKNANSGTSNSTWSTSIPPNGSNSVASMVNAPGSLTATTTPTGTNNNGYNAAAAGNVADRMIATSPTSVAGGAIQLQLANNSGGYIDRLLIGYDIYRINAPSSANELPGYWLFYSIDNGSTWTNVQALNPIVSGPAGIIVPNTIGKTAVPQTPLALSGNWNPGRSIYFRWVDDNGVPTSPDQMYGLDNVSIRTPTPLQLNVATSGFVYSRSTRTYSGIITLTNSNQAAISGQVLVSLTNLTPGVTLLNASGNDNISPYLALTFGEQLNPGETISIPLTFSNPSNAKIIFVPSIYGF